MAALDDLVAALVFFLVIAFVSAHISTQGIPVALVVLVVFLPVFLGIVTGLVTGLLLRLTHTRNSSVAVMAAMLLLSAGLGFWIMGLLPISMFNFMLLGMSFSTVVAN